MNSFPVQLLPMEMQLNVLGAGARPPGADETATGGDAFLGLLQQLLLGGSVQMPGSATALTSDSGGQETGGAGPEEGPIPPGTDAALAAADAATDLVTLQIAGGSTSTVPQSGTAVATVPQEGAPHPAQLTAIPPAAPDGPDAAMEKAGTLPVAPASVPVESEEMVDPMVLITARARPRVDERITTPVLPTEEQADNGVQPLQKDDRPHPASPRPETGAPTTARPATEPAAWMASRMARRTTQPDRMHTASSNVPVSTMEEDRAPERAQATAPAPVEEASGGDDLARMVHVLKHVAAATASADGDRAVRAGMATNEERPQVARTEPAAAAGDAGPDAVASASRTVPAAGGGSHEAGLQDGPPQRDHAFTPQVVPVVARADAARGLEFGARTAEVFASLPPETAQSVVDQVVKGLSLQVNGDNSEIRVRLVPESLGEVTVRVRMEEGRMQAQVEVSQASVKAALETQLPQLRQSLHARGIEVQRLDVSYAGDRPAQESGGGQGDRRQRQGGSRRMYSVDAVEQYETGRLMGYNTMEMVM